MWKIGTSDLHEKIVYTKRRWSKMLFRSPKIGACRGYFWHFEYFRGDVGLGAAVERVHPNWEACILSNVPSRSLILERNFNEFLIHTTYIHTYIFAKAAPDKLSSLRETSWYLVGYPIPELNIHMCMHIVGQVETCKTSLYRYNCSCIHCSRAVLGFEIGLRKAVTRIGLHILVYWSARMSYGK